MAKNKGKGRATEADSAPAPDIAPLRRSKKSKKADENTTENAGKGSKKGKNSQSGGVAAVKTRDAQVLFAQKVECRKTNPKGVRLICQKKPEENASVVAGYLGLQSVMELKELLRRGGKLSPCELEFTSLL
jgi:hypothetical protein